MRRVNTLCVALVICIVGATWLGAHETSTHKLIGDIAVQYLFKTQPSRPILTNSVSTLTPLLEVGAEQEDDEVLLGAPAPELGRYYFHFNPRLDFAPVWGLGLIDIQGSCTSSQWGDLNNLGTTCTATCNVPLVCSNSYGPYANSRTWSQDLASDGTGAPTQTSVKELGYLIHLLEDLGSPAHTRNDFHACPTKFLLYCDPFEKTNDGIKPQMPTGAPDPSLNASTFTTPDQFFTALQSYTSNNYYSDNTTGSAGPQATDADLLYFYGACTQASTTYGTCGTVKSGLRKIAAKGPLFYAMCGDVGNCLTTFDMTFAKIDATIAKEQFQELGPVIAQHVAAFLQFYAPALTVTLSGTSGAGTGKVTAGTGGATQFTCASAQSGTPACSGLFVQTAKAAPSVTLTATADPGSTFTGWSGACSGTAMSTKVTLNGDQSCTATFGTVYRFHYVYYITFEIGCQQTARLSFSAVTSSGGISVSDSASATGCSGGNVGPVAAGAGNDLYFTGHATTSSTGSGEDGCYVEVDTLENIGGVNYGVYTSYWGGSCKSGGGDFISRSIGTGPQ